MNPRLARLHDPDWRVRFAATKELEGKATPDDADDIAPLLKDVESGIRVRACHLLAAIRAVQHVPNIAPLLDDPWWGCRSAAAFALTSLGASEYAGRIAKLAHDENDDVQSSALNAIWDLRAAEHVDELIPLMARAHWLRSQAAEIIVRLGGVEKAEAVVPLLHSADAKDRTKGLELIAIFANPSHRPLVEPLTRDRIMSVRRCAAGALALMDPEREGVRLYAALKKTRRTDVRVQLLRFILESRAPGPVESIATAMARPESDAAGWAALVLARRGSHDYDRELLDLAASSVRSLRCSARIAMARLGLPEGSDHLAITNEVERELHEDRGCFGNPYEVKLADALFETLIFLHARPLHDVLSRTSTLGRRVSSRSDLALVMQERGTRLHVSGPDEAFLDVAPQGMRGDLFRIVRECRTGILTPSGDGIELVGLSESLSFWRKRLAAAPRT